MSADPFGTAGVRERVLAAWTSSPDRFREDANAEEDLALGGYRDRLVVELAQNAADAAARSGVPGRLLLRLAETPDGPLLVAANTGAPLDAEGVRGLASLRASGKRGEDAVATVGRFGVGFAAVLAVSDEPAIVSSGRGVRFSRQDTLALVRDAARAAPGLSAELDRRDGHVPVLRLPFATDGAAPEGYDTAVLLPLRDGAAADLTERLLLTVDDALLLALPGLAEVAVELPERPRHVVAAVTSRWHSVRREGAHPPEVLADRPTEERERAAWAVSWALPRPGPDAPVVPPVLHAPTPTDEPLAWPALLVATFPLDPTRRHVAPGPATDALVGFAAAAYADLLRDRAEEGDDVLALVPTGLAAGQLDARLREEVLAALPAVPLLREVQHAALVRPRDAVAITGAAGDDDAALAVLAPLVAGLVAAPPRARAALDALGVRRLALADLVDQLPAGAPAGTWAQRYAGLATAAADPGVREELAAIPVPLVDGRVVRGPRGSWLAAPGLDGAALAPLAAAGLRVVHPSVAADPAAARLLERLGARTGGPGALLEDPALPAAVEAAADGAWGDGVRVGEDDLAEAVLTLVAAAVDAGELRPGSMPWLADLPLADGDGQPAPAGELVLPGSPAADLLDPDEVVPVAPEVVQRWGGHVLEAVGVARSLAVTRAHDVDPHDLPDEIDVLDGAREWAREWAAGCPGGTAAEVLAVRDLDLVRDDAWPRAIAVIASDPALRAAVTEPLVVRAPDATATTGSYSAWWLRRRLALAGRADAGAEPALGALLPPAPRWVAAADDALRAALGVARRFEDLDGAGWAAALRALTDREHPLPVVLATWRALAAAATAAPPPALDPPARLRLPSAGGTAIVDAREVAVADSPMWLQRADVGPVLPAPAGAAEPLADLLDVDLASERAAGVVAGSGTPEAVPAEVAALLPDAPTSWYEHDELRVDGVEVDWWVVGAGTSAQVHAATLAGLARGLAQAAGRWRSRLAIEEVLVEPAAATRVLIEESTG